jgi:hypothetical protein
VRQVSDLVGNRFSKLLVERFSHTKNGYSYWSCLCDCGARIETRGVSLKQGNTKSCGCVRAQKLAKRHASKSLRDLAITDRMSNYRSEARRKGHEFELSRQEFATLVFGNCVYCGESPQNAFKAKRAGVVQVIKLNGIDRFDNSKGYRKDNCLTCCQKCNSLKSAIPLWLVKKIYEIQSSKEFAG